MHELEIPTMPIWDNVHEADRCDHTALRKRMLDGTWYQDLLDELSNHISSARQDAWGEPDMSSNIFKETTKTLCALYMKPPVVTHPSSEEQAKGLLGSNGEIARACLWGLQKRTQFYTVGLRESMLRVDVSPEGRLSYRIVTPDCVSAGGKSYAQEELSWIKEMRLRVHPETGEYQWTLDYLDISNPQQPIYQVLVYVDEGGKQTLMDGSSLYLGGDYSGENYPYIDSEGVPYLPYSLYHAEITGKLFDAFYNHELVKGSLSAAVLYSYFLHLSRDCAHPQRYIYNAMPAGLQTTDGQQANSAVVESDAASIMVFVSTGEPGEAQIQAQFGQFQAGGDVTKTIEAITTYERRLATLAGINPADVQKMSGDPRSGYAISISRSSLREAQAEYSPSFRRADLATIEITAKMLNAMTGTNYPESGYQIDYYEIPKSEQELKAEREDRNDKIDRGLMSSIQAVMMMFPDYDRDDAINYLRQVKKDNAEIM